MTKSKTKKPDSRAKALHAMNRATLIHTVQTLDKRQVTLLNKIAKLEDAAKVCGEAYQVVGSLLADVGQFGNPIGQKIMDNLSQQRMVHNDVLPWPSFVDSDRLPASSEIERDACVTYGVAVQDHDFLPRNKMPWET